MIRRPICFWSWVFTLAGSVGLYAMEAGNPLYCPEEFAKSYDASSPQPSRERGDKASQGEVRTAFPQMRGYLLHTSYTPASFQDSFGELVRKKPRLFLPLVYPSPNKVEGGAPVPTQSFKPNFKRRDALAEATNQALSSMPSQPSYPLFLEHLQDQWMRKKGVQMDKGWLEMNPPLHAASLRELLQTYETYIFRKLSLHKSALEKGRRFSPATEQAFLTALAKIGTFLGASARTFQRLMIPKGLADPRFNFFAGTIAADIIFIPLSTEDLKNSCSSLDLLQALLSILEKEVHLYQLWLPKLPPEGAPKSFYPHLEKPIGSLKKCLQDFQKAPKETLPGLITELLQSSRLQNIQKAQENLISIFQPSKLSLAGRPLRPAPHSLQKRTVNQGATIDQVVEPKEPEEDKRKKEVFNPSVKRRRVGSIAPLPLEGQQASEGETSQSASHRALLSGREIAAPSQDLGPPLPSRGVGYVSQMKLPIIIPRQVEDLAPMTVPPFQDLLEEIFSGNELMAALAASAPDVTPSLVSEGPRSEEQPPFSEALPMLHSPQVSQGTISWQDLKQLSPMAYDDPRQSPSRA